MAPPVGNWHELLFLKRGEKMNKNKIVFVPVEVTLVMLLVQNVIVYFTASEYCMSLEVI